MRNLYRTQGVIIAVLLSLGGNAIASTKADTLQTSTGTVVDGFRWTVTKVVDRGSFYFPPGSDEARHPDTGNHFVQVFFEVEVVGKKPTQIQEAPRLVDSDGREYTFDTGSDSPLWHVLMNPGKKGKFDQIFEVPSSAKKGFSVKVRDGATVPAPDPVTGLKKWLQ